jgi:hypothetical protein
LFVTLFADPLSIPQLEKMMLDERRSYYQRLREIFDVADIPGNILL